MSDVLFVRGVNQSAWPIDKRDAEAIAAKPRLIWWGMDFGAPPRFSGNARDRRRARRAWQKKMRVPTEYYYTSDLLSQKGD